MTLLQVASLTSIIAPSLHLHACSAGYLSVADVWWAFAFLMGTCSH